MSLIGRRVMLIRTHPHKGKVGVVSSIDKVDGDTALNIQLDGTYDGSCYAFPGEWQLIWEK